jgi:2-polyprenyl-3-methyl-5-hydroxy-6-metoxy-1,4-benzoquinol methylase
MSKTYPSIAPADWPYRLAPDLPAEQAARLRGRAEALQRAAQYGWGHTIDFGPFRMPGLLGDNYLRIAALLDDWGWWPKSLAGMAVADVGCYTGGLALVMAARGAARVHAVDEIPEHLAQCAFLAETFGVRTVECLEASLYQMPRRIAAGSLDLILLSGVLYHLSDMMVGLVALRQLLKPEGVLLIETTAVDCFTHSYANFGRFCAGIWWQPTALCIQDLLGFTGFRDGAIRFYRAERCLARATRGPDSDIRFRRGMNWTFPDIHDAEPRTLDVTRMAPAPCTHEE